MSEFHVEGHVTHSLRSARMRDWPYPYFFAGEVFPWEFYWKLQDIVAERDGYKAGGSHLYGRAFSTPNDVPGLEFIGETRFLKQVVQMFYPELKAHFKDKGKPELFTDTRLVRDGKGYQIGPHTDAPWKLISLLFYLPRDGEFEECGTSIYLPKNREFRCPGGPHHKFEDFDKIFTTPFVPNTCFGFFKTDNSFHGVEPITVDIQRDVLLYNVYDKEVYLQHHQTDNG